MASWEAPVPLPGNRVPGKTEPCTAADGPLGRRVFGRAGPTWNDRCPRVYHDRDAGRPSGPLTRENLTAGRIYHLQYRIER